MTRFVCSYCAFIGIFLAISHVHLAIAAEPTRSLSDTAEAQTEQHITEFNRLYSAASIQIKEKNFHLALEPLMAAAALNEAHDLKRNEVYNALGWVHMSLSKFSEAEKYFKRVLDNADQNPRGLNQKANNNLGLLYYAQGKIGATRRQMQATAQKYQSPTARRTLSQLNSLERKRWETEIKTVFRLALKDGRKVADKIWQNESDGTIEGLTAWNRNENHASFGIGHFIWYPQQVRSRFEETFPKLIHFLALNQAPVPHWLTQTRHCPWPNRDAFYRDIDSPRMNELRQLMQDTLPLQVDFMLNRLAAALPKMIDELRTEAERTEIENKFNNLARTPTGDVFPHGVFVMLDYVNFKGEGTNPNERYRDQGWGLLQVLQTMPAHSAQPIEDFIRAAKQVLARRINNAPADRNENRWREGWWNRLEGYREF